MTKDVLIERLATLDYEATKPTALLQTGRYAYFTALPETTQERYREHVSTEWPLIVEFVESWIERDGGFDDAAVDRANRWREQMS